MGKETILLTVAARGGSKGVKNKNIRELCGKPLIAHTILQAKRWGKAEKIVCSTDSKEIAQVASEYGAQVPFMRPDEIATDKAGKIDALRHALKTMEERDNKKYSILVDLDATAPVRTTDDIERALQLFLDKRPDVVVSVTSCRKNPYYNMLEVGEDGYARVVKRLEERLVRRQDAPVVFDMNASIYVYDREFLLDEKNTSPLSGRTLPVEMDEWTAFDIDTEVDFQLIEFLTQKKLVTL